MNQFFLYFTTEYIKWRAVRSVLEPRNKVQKKSFQCLGAVALYLDLNGISFYPHENFFSFKQDLSSWETHVSINELFFL